MSSKALNLIIVVGLLLSFPGVAAVYQCQAPGGGITFSDTPCDDAASGQKLENFTRVVTRAVSATVSHRQTTHRYLDGYAYWVKPERELTAVLYLRNLSDEEHARAAGGERLNTYEEASTGRVTLLFDGPRARKATLRHMRSVFIGFSPENPKSPWTSNHRKEDMVDVVEKFYLGKDDEGVTWLEFRSKESSENIRWQIDFALPVVP